MGTYLLTWNPNNWKWPREEIDRGIEETAAGRTWPGRWSVGVRRHDIKPGDRAFLMRQGSERGLVASGEFTSEIFVEPHWDGSGRPAGYAKIDWDAVLPVEDRLPVEDLKHEVPGVFWDRLEGAGVAVPESSEGALESAWAEHVRGVPYRSPEEESPSYPEGTLTRILVNRYERDRHARTACIAKYGTTCSACGIDFEAVYGPIGRGFIHVHHLKDLSLVGPDYQIDPVKDLRPVCPNCHTMLHTSRPAMSIKKLQGHLKQAANTRP